MNLRLAYLLTIECMWQYCIWTMWTVAILSTSMFLLVWVLFLLLYISCCTHKNLFRFPRFHCFHIPHHIGRYIITSFLPTGLHQYAVTFTLFSNILTITPPQPYRTCNQYYLCLHREVHDFQESPVQFLNKPGTQYLVHHHANQHIDLLLLHRKRKQIISTYSTRNIPIVFSRTHR